MPAHALLVHGAVVFGPLAGLLAVGYAVPALRERLRGVTLVFSSVFPQATQRPEAHPTWRLAAPPWCTKRTT